MAFVIATAGTLVLVFLCVLGYAQDPEREDVYVATGLIVVSFFLVILGVEIGKGIQPYL